MKLVEMGIAAKDIVTMESLENAIMVHAAISGSTNAVMHTVSYTHLDEYYYYVKAVPKNTVTAQDVQVKQINPKNARGQKEE